MNDDKEEEENSDLEKATDGGAEDDAEKDLTDMDLVNPVESSSEDGEKVPTQ